MIRKALSSAAAASQQQRSLLAAAAPKIAAARRTFSSNKSEDDFDPMHYYYVEASNAERPDITMLSVTGPDKIGILASMTVALASQGCSITDLHAGHAPGDPTAIHHSEEEEDMVKDVFYVVNCQTGKQFHDDQLQPLAVALLEATSKPMKVLGSTEPTSSIPKIYSLEKQIKIVPATATKK